MPTMVDKSKWTVGNYNAYVGSGTTREERRERLAEVPEEYRDSVESHVRTQFQIQAANKKAALDA